MALFRFKAKVLGAHTRVRVFAGEGNASLGLCGNLVFRNEEWSDFLKELDRRPPGGSIEILSDENEADDV